MTLFIWDAAGGGSFGNPQNWFNTASQRDNDGAPGAGDQATLTVPGITVTVGGETVGNLEGPSGRDRTTLSGSLIVIDTLSGFDLTGGAFQAGTAQAVRFSGTSLHAGTVLASDLLDGTVSADRVEGTRIRGATVSAQDAGDVRLFSGRLDVTALSLGDTNNGELAGIFGGRMSAGSLTMTSGSVLSVAGGGKGVVSGLTLLQDGAWAAPQITVGRDIIDGQHSGAAYLNLQGGLRIETISQGGITTSNGATTTIRGPAVIDMFTTAATTGLVSDGGTTVVNGRLTLGESLKGQITVVNGGQASVDTLTAGKNISTAGTVRIDGAGSRADFGSALIGAFGTGTLDVLSGAECYVAGSLTLGLRGTSTGSAFVGYAGADAASYSGGLEANRITVGWRGTGDLTVTGHMTVICDDWLVAGLDGAGDGTVTVSAGGALRAQRVAIGADGDGRLSVAGTSGGDGSLLAWSGDFAVGSQSGSGLVAVGAGGTIKPLSGATAADFLVGFGAGSSGAVIVAGQGAQLTATSIQICAVTDNGGSGSIEVGDGGVVEARDGAIRVYANGELAVTGTGRIVAPMGVALHGGLFDISVASAAVSVTRLTGEGTVDLGGRMLTLTDARGSFAGLIDGDGGRLRLTGGTERLAGADNSFTGGIRLDGGTLVLAAHGAAGTGPVIFGSGAQTLAMEGAAFHGGRLGTVLTGFGAGDTLDFVSLSADGAQVRYGAVSHVLTVSSGGASLSVRLDAPGGTAFTVTDDGHGSAAVSLATAPPALLSADDFAFVTDPDGLF